MNERVTVHKLDYSGREVWSYTGRSLGRQTNAWTLEAHFDRDDFQAERLVLRRGDRFVETYYEDRWYNVFAVYDVHDGRLKGFYCNIARPARFVDPGDIFAEDLALDLIIDPDGNRVVLDEEEFAALPLSPAERRRAQLALAELQSLAMQRQGPFTALPPP